MTLQLTSVAPGLTGEASRAADSGVVVGLSEPEREGWLVRNGVITILAPGTHEVAPRGVNDAGIVVGTIGTDSDRGAFLYDGSMTDLQPALETHAGDARDITNSGVVVGARARVAEPRTAFRLDTTTGTLTAIPFAAALSDEYVTSIAAAVTPDGRFAVGLASKAFSEAGHGFVYDHTTGESIDLGPHVFPRAVNAHGLIGGADPSTGDVITFDIATHILERRGRGLAEGINDDGVVIGSMSTSGPVPSAAFFSRPGQGLVDVNTLLAPGGNRRMTSAADIDNHGRIVGAAIAIDPVTGESVPNPATGGTQPTPVLLTID